ncbi:MAG TPA: hypothetical protein VM345_05960 [Acidimicrobiales bacterium]|jgi:hypothetical protein|nr:hypothetical protein [Acidimicrobiales bacterium]
MTPFTTQRLRAIGSTSADHGYADDMAMRRNDVATPDRHARLLLAAVLAVAAVVFVWLVATLAMSAFS